MSDIESVTSTSAKPKPKQQIDNNVITMTKKGLKIDRRGKKKIINIKYNIYGTGLIGKIRSAVTGEYFDNMVGSNDEHLFFKVYMTTGPKPLTLFYRSPAEYELHQQRDYMIPSKNEDEPPTVDPNWDNIRTAWRYKRNRYANA